MDLTSKCRYVAGVDITDHTPYMTCVSVVRFDSVCIDLLIAALNDLDILAGDIQNALLNAQTKEKYFSMLVINGSMLKENYCY